jgi:replicative DNA helicase
MALQKKQNYKKQEQLLGKQLPANIEAEKSVLGAILLNDENFSKVAEILVADDFYHPAHQLIFANISELIEKFKRIDLVTLQDELEKKGQLEQAGGIIYLITLQENIPAVGLIEQHAEIVKEKSTLRQIIRSSTEIIGHCYKQADGDISSVLDFAEKTIFEIASNKTKESFVQLDIWLKRTFKHLSEIKSHSKGITGIPTGFNRLDEMTSGLQKGDFVVLAGRPSMGKSAIALNFLSSAVLSGGSVGFFSLEMPAEQLTLRLLSSTAGIPIQKIRNATITSEEWIELTNVAAQLAKQKIFIDDTAGINIMELRTRARKLKAEHGIKMIMVDYLQLLHSARRHENRHQEVSEISRSLKALAKELSLPVVALSQLSRAVDSRMDKRPMLSDLRESGAIEQDADLIMFLYRDVVYNPDTEDPELTELIVGKQRNGPTGMVELNFIGALSKFEGRE